LSKAEAAQKRGPKRYGRRAAVILLALLAVTSLLWGAACGGRTEATEVRQLVLASTTSTQDSGLFDVLVPAFQNTYPQYRVNVIAAGTGEALRLGEEKAADVLLVHSPQAEQDFVEAGFGLERLDVMYNDFVLLGPAADPAGVRSAADARTAFVRIAETASAFLSRGDESGTHKKERALWAGAGIEPSAPWYWSAGQGMSEVLRISSEKRAYTLSDRATFLANQGTLELEILFEGDDSLFNPYGVIPVTDATNEAGARDFVAWVTSEEGQAVIAAFGVEQFGQPLFVPNAE
jgi:tungstate transport system substrate-binding protein